MGEVPRGTHVWYDLMTTDPAGAVDFYGKVVGWTITPFEGAPEPYDMWTSGKGPIGGVMELPADAREMGAPTHWIAYICTPDADATAARATELGGTVLVPAQDIPEVGRFCVIQDPQGGVFSAFTPAGESPPRDGRAAPGEMSWHELMADDYEKAFSFYSDLFGWEKTTAMDMGEMGMYQLFTDSHADGDVGGMMNRPPEMPTSAWLYYINVADVDAAVEVVTANGGQILHGPMDVPGGDRVVSCMDPQGGAFALHMFAKE